MKWATFIMVVVLTTLALIGQITFVDQAFLMGLVLLIYKVCQGKQEGKFNKKNRYKNLLNRGNPGREK